MSVVVVVKVSEGIVLAADSAATLHGKVQFRGEEINGIVQTYLNARKVLQIGDFPIGLATWGTAFIGERTVESIVREWEHDQKWRSCEQYKTQHKGLFSVKECAESLRQFVTKAYGEAFPDTAQEKPPLLGVMVAGYSEAAFFSEVWKFVLPHDGEVHDARPDIEGKPNFGAGWFGRTDAIVRFHFGRDDAVPAFIEEKFGIQKDEVRKALAPLEYPVTFKAMPLQDAIEYAHFMVGLTIGRYHHVVGPEYCAGKIDIAAITPQALKWVAKKEHELKLEA